MILARVGTSIREIFCLSFFKLRSKIFTRLFGPSHVQKINKRILKYTSPEEKNNWKLWRYVNNSPNSFFLTEHIEFLWIIQEFGEEFLRSTGAMRRYIILVQFLFLFIYLAYILEVIFGRWRFVRKKIKTPIKKLSWIFLSKIRYRNIFYQLFFDSILTNRIFNAIRTV